MLSTERCMPLVYTSLLNWVEEMGSVPLHIIMIIYTSLLNWVEETGSVPLHINMIR